MLTPQSAYKVFRKKHPEEYVKFLFDFGGDYYRISGDTEFRVDKRTGDISEMTFLEYMLEVGKHKDSDYKRYLIKDFEKAS